MSEEIVVGEIVFSRQRIALVRDSSFITSFAVDASTLVEIRSERLSEHPLRELFWGVGALLAGAVFLTDALSRHDTSSFVGGVFFVGIGMWILRHLQRQATFVIVGRRGEGSLARIALGIELEGAAAASLSQRLSQELGYCTPHALRE